MHTAMKPEFVWLQDRCAWSHVLHVELAKEPMYRKLIEQGGRELKGAVGTSPRTAAR